MANLTLLLVYPFLSPSSCLDAGKATAWLLSVVALSALPDGEFSFFQVTQPGYSSGNTQASSALC